MWLLSRIFSCLLGMPKAWAYRESRAGRTSGNTLVGPLLASLMMLRFCSPHFQRGPTPAPDHPQATRGHLQAQWNVP